MSSARRRLVLLVAAATIAIDLAAKAAAVRWLTSRIDAGIITIRVTENSGVAFGVGADQPFVVIAAISGVVVAAIAASAWRGHLGGPIGAGLLVGGGTANLLDRLTGGAVVDLFDLGWWPVFNLADVALTIGVVLTMVTSIRDEAAPSAEPSEDMERA